MVVVLTATTTSTDKHQPKTNKQINKLSNKQHYNEKDIDNQLERQRFSY